MKYPRKGLMILVCMVCFLTACVSPEEPMSDPTAEPEDSSERDGWELVWQDEFDLSYLDTENWIYDTGAGGWGNEELQFYTNSSKNVRTQEGMLIIEARQENHHGNDYTSARIKTQTLHSWTYGRIEARMKLPTGQGIWPAFWMLGEDFPSAGWPDCGEIDIMENIGDPWTIYGTVHGPGYSGGNGIGSSATTSGDPLNEAFHTYAIEWQPDEIRWYLDGIEYHTVTNADVPGKWVFDHPFFIILNLAVGGEWPGYPDQTTQFPQQLVVDYVRVYRDPDLDLSALEKNKLHAAELRMDLKEEEDTVMGEVYVTVVDQNGEPVEGALVTVGWLGVVTGATREAETDEEGVAGPFIAQKTSYSDEITLCVYDIAKRMYRYDKEANPQTCVYRSP
ncbi:MAG: family 16 glycosylhydrolase [Chloroflexota bacterium]